MRSFLDRVYWKWDNKEKFETHVCYATVIGYAAKKNIPNRAKTLHLMWYQEDTPDNRAICEWLIEKIVKPSIPDRLKPYVKWFASEPRVDSPGFYWFGHCEVDIYNASSKDLMILACLGRHGQEQGIQVEKAYKAWKRGNTDLSPVHLFALAQLSTWGHHLVDCKTFFPDDALQALPNWDIKKLWTKIPIDENYVTKPGNYMVNKYFYCGTFDNSHYLKDEAKAAMQMFLEKHNCLDFLDVPRDAFRRAEHFMVK